MTLPIANAGSAGADIAYATWVGVTTRALADGGSTPGSGGASIASRLWSIVDKPTGSAAALTGATTETPTLAGIDLAGNYRIMLVVTDDIGSVSEADPFAAPASAFVSVRATTRYGALYKYAEGQRDYIDEIHANLDALDSLIGAVGGGTAPRVVWIQAQAGDADADGSMVRPFNPVSAAAAAVAGPWAQAIAALEAMDLTDNPSTGLTIIALGGTYTEAVTITQADVPWYIMCHGAVIFSGAPVFSFSIKSVGYRYPPSLNIKPMGYGAFATPGQFRLGDAVGGILWGVTLDSVHVESMAVATTLVSGCFLEMVDCACSGALNLPNLIVNDARNSRFTGLMTVLRIESITRCSLGAITVAEAGGDNEAGFYDNGWGASRTFTGPAGSAQFDPITAQRFIEEFGVYAGGAGASDHLIAPVHYAIIPVGVLANGTAKFYFLDAHAAFGGYSTRAFRGAIILQALYRAAVAATSPGTITIGVKHSFDGTDAIAPVDMKTMGSGQLVPTPILLLGGGDGAYANVISNNVTVTQPLGGALHVWYVPLGSMT